MFIIEGCGWCHTCSSGTGEKDWVSDGWDWVPQEDAWWGETLIFN